MIRTLIYSAICSLFAFIACNNDDKIDYTATGKLAGTWWVTYETETAPGVWEDTGDGHLPLLTYNTAANKTDEMFVDDQGEFWDFKVKSYVTPGSNRFGADKELPNLSYEDCNVKITGGLILFDMGCSKTGIVTDSICFYIQFSDDPDNLKYKVSGHKRTGWDFDEY